jgi:hypothetical protein
MICGATSGCKCATGKSNTERLVELLENNFVA